MEWKTITKFPLYECSFDGKIRKKDTKRISKAKPNKSGYIRITLKKEFCKHVTVAVHRMIAETWLDK